MNYLLVFKLVPETGESNLNITKGKKLFIECPEGNFTESDLVEREERGDKIVRLKIKEHHGIKQAVVKGDDGWLMFGGCYVECEDSRFSRMSKYPLAIMDRDEG